MPHRICFTAELAGIPIEIRCSYEENRTFLQDYLTEKAPLFTVEPTDADMERMRLGLDQIALAEGRKPIKHTESYLENNAIHSLIAEGLTAYDVLLIHGSALCMDGEAYLFTAPSGTGKAPMPDIGGKCMGNESGWSMMTNRCCALWVMMFWFTGRPGMANIA